MIPVSEFFGVHSLLPLLNSAGSGNSAAAHSGVLPIHTAVKGRARLKIVGLYRDCALKSALQRKLCRAPGIISVSANELTGNLLVVFEPSRDFQEIIAAIDQLVQALARSRNASDSAAAVDPKPSALPRESASPDRARSRSRQQRFKLLTPTPSRPWHLLNAQEALLTLKSSKRRGLASSLALERLNQYGPNRLPEALPRSALSIFLNQFKSLPVVLLGASAAVSVFTGGLADAAVILAVVFINAGIGFFTESQAEKTISALTGRAQRSALVLRDGSVLELPAEQVVLGDVLALALGSYVAADARLIETINLTVDESALTGESQPVLKSPERLYREEVPLAERLNMVYMGTAVTGGSGLALVVATGQHTEIGAIQRLMGETRPPETPMQRQLDQLGNQMVWLSGAVCGLVFVAGLLRGYGFIQMLGAAVSLAVAAVPEGLPTVATTTLALGLRDMRKMHVLIRRLEAVETLGSVQMICLDKTGTLTLNRMSVLSLYAGMERVTVTEGVLLGVQGRIDPYAHDGVLRLIHVAVLCNETEVKGTQGAYVLNGSATESALVQLAITSGVAVNQLRRHYPLLKVEYRAENRNYMSTLHETEGGMRLLAVKGSPSEVLDLCRFYVTDGHIYELTEADRALIRSENERMAAQALRVLGFAYGEGPEGIELGQKDLVWLGLAGMADPIRRGVKELIALFHQAGIKTVMITGDQSATAYAIGKELGLSGGRRLEILDSSHLERIDPQVMSALAQKTDVFARVSPANKLQIVQGLQRAGKVVAMTGDGINDGPALKAADIGVAMGHTGTDVARAVADVVLEDDNLQTMIVAVSQGRTIYNNIRKSIRFLMSSNVGEIGLMVAAIGAGMGVPLNTMQLLWINLLTDIFPALALSMEPPEPDVLRQPPRDPNLPIISKTDLKRYGLESLTITAGAMGSYGYGLLRYGLGPQANTLAFMTLTQAQLLHAYSCRSETHGIFSEQKLPSNRYLDLAVGGSFVLQLLTVFVPGLRALLGTTPIGLLDMLAITVGAVLPFIMNEAGKPPPSPSPGGREGVGIGVTP